MQTEQESLNAISAAALQVCSREELVQMPRPQRSSLMHLIAKRLDRLPPPTQDALQGIKELVLEHLWHPALAALSPASQTSPTMSSATSASPQPTDPLSGEPSVDPTNPML